MQEEKTSAFIESLAQPGTRVRMKYEPDQIGECTGKAEDDMGDYLVQVRFNGRRPDWIASDDLELFEDEQPDDFTRIRTGRIDGIDALRRAFSRIQLSGKLAEMFYSMDTTHTEFLPHQFKPVLAMLDSPSQGLLIADEVGLGKTIEAGLIWTELRFRKQARRLLVVCPAMLTEKWQYELQYRFGTTGYITGAKGLLEFIEHPERFSADNQCVICSLQGIRPPADWESANNTPVAQLAKKLNEASWENPLFDMTIIDEAHYLRNPKTSSARLGRMLRNASDHLALLTATPVNTKNTDLHSLVSLVDPDQFQYSGQFESILEANRPLVQASNLLKVSTSTFGDISQQLLNAQAHWVLTSSEQLRELVDELSEKMDAESPSTAERILLRERVERINLLSHIVTRTRKREVLEKRVIRQAKHYPVKMSPCETKAYDLASEAILDYAQRNEFPEGFLLAMPQRQMSSCIHAAVKHWLSMNTENEDSDEQAWEDHGQEQASADGLIAHMGRYITHRVDLDELYRNDSKFNYLEGTLKKFLKDYPKEKIIIFSYFRKTLSYLHERLEKAGIASVVVKGGQDKKAIIDNFKNSQSLQVLLASEVASEGVDLQFMRFLVNYDLPWNPMKVEQRIGRIDRFGQNAEVINILNVVYKDTIDERILDRLYVRLNLFESALGGAEEVIGEEISRMAKTLLSGKLDKKQQQEQIEQTAAAIEQRRHDEEIINENATELMGLGDFVNNKIISAHNAHRKVSDQDLIKYIEDFLSRHDFGHKFSSQQGSNHYTISLSANTALDFGDFIKNNRLTPSSLSSGHESIYRIENNVNSGIRMKHELLNPFHPFIKYINYILNKKEHHIPLSTLSLSSATVPLLNPDNVYVFKVESWSFSGSKDEDYLRAALTSLDDSHTVIGSDAFDTVGQIRLHAHDWLQAATAINDANTFIEAMDKTERFLSQEFNRERRDKQLENNDRIKIQTESVERNYQRKKASLAETINNAFDEKIARMHRGRLKKLENETAMHLERLQRNKKVALKKESVALGILKVYL